MAAPRPDRIYPPPLTWAVLPALTSFAFQGASEYLEGLVSQIDGSQVNQIYILYLNQLVDFQATHFSRFINRSACPEGLSSHYSSVHMLYFLVRGSTSPHVVIQAIQTETAKKTLL